MNGVGEITATKCEAKQKYREYRSALARHPEPWIRELKDGYNQLRRGHGIIDLFKAFKKAGVNAHGEPRLAIYPANVARCVFRKVNGENGGGGEIVWRSGYQSRRPIVSFPERTFPVWPSQKNQWGITEITRQYIFCPVPVVPPHLLPRADLSNFYILWEVEKWDAEAPRDPILLKRVSANLFAVMAKWDLTELERAVIAGRIR